jgi:hypothetical protein
MSHRYPRRLPYAAKLSAALGALSTDLYRAAEDEPLSELNADRVRRMLARSRRILARTPRQNHPPLPEGAPLTRADARNALSILRFVLDEELRINPFNPDAVHRLQRRAARPRKPPPPRPPAPLSP